MVSRDAASNVEGGDVVNNGDESVVTKGLGAQTRWGDAVDGN